MADLEGEKVPLFCCTVAGQTSEGFWMGCMGKEAVGFFFLNGRESLYRLTAVFVIVNTITKIVSLATGSASDRWIGRDR